MHTVFVQYSSRIRQCFGSDSFFAQGALKADEAIERTCVNRQAKALPPPPPSLLPPHSLASPRRPKVLFEMARFHAPSTIFVDEVDALMAARQGEQEHEASRRMKTQLLVELDGLTKSNDHVFLLAASNVPW